VCLFLIAVKL